MTYIEKFSYVSGNFIVINLFIGRSGFYSKMINRERDSGNFENNLLKLAEFL